MRYKTLKNLRRRHRAREIIRRRINRRMGWVIFGLVICIIFASLIGCVGFHG
tara:strand:+ start:440 stop:595 length:156 start_codon:yes stop_codon:yes gene_type:complete